jgi:hypothetical protein
MSDVTYELRVTGPVPEKALEDFGDLRMSTTAVYTVLFASVTDQSALLGLLAKLRALGLDVMEVRRVLEGVEDEQEPQPESAPAPRAVDG